MGEILGMFPQKLVTGANLLSESANGPSSPIMFVFSTTLGKLILKSKNSSEIKILTVRDPFTYQGLSKPYHFQADLINVTVPYH
jgi:hypothetical protein